jgi:hypothetical protein
VLDEGFDVALGVGDGPAMSEFCQGVGAWLCAEDAAKCAQQQVNQMHKKQRDVETFQYKEIKEAGRETTATQTHF